MHTRQERTLRRARCQPCFPIVVTAADAASFPCLGESDRDLGSFDCVLVDVPCSGDGARLLSALSMDGFEDEHGRR